MVPEQNPREIAERIVLVQRQAMDALGFFTPRELANKSGLHPATVSRILTGKTKRIGDETACRLIETIYKQNVEEGYTAKDCIKLLIEVLEFSWCHCAHIYREVEPFQQTITESDILRWNVLVRQRLFRHTLPPGHCLHQFVASENVQRNLEQLVRFADSWSVKHDFNFQDKIEIEIGHHLSVIETIIRQGIEQNLYSSLKEVFSRMQYALHLCGQFKLVLDVSQWLLDKAIEHEDFPMNLRAKVMLAWTLTSSKNEENYRRAEKLIQSSCESITQVGNLQSLKLDDMDIIAILSELIIRLPLRIQMNGGRKLSTKQFAKLSKQARKLLGEIENTHVCPENLRIRYQIPLDYQTGIYFFLKKDYDNALTYFRSVSREANLIGWQRISIASYSWLASINIKLKNTEAGKQYLEQMGQYPRQKRRELKARISEEIESIHN